MRRGSTNTQNNLEKKSSSTLMDTINEDSIFAPSSSNIKPNNNYSRRSSIRPIENQKVKRKGFKILDYEDITFGKYLLYFKVIILTFNNLFYFFILFYFIIIILWNIHLN